MNPLTSQGNSVTTSALRESAHSGRAHVIMGALLVWGLFVCLAGPLGWHDMLARGPMEADAVMRLAQIKDLLAGQSLFDLTHDKMNAPFGLEMHWSRLIDVPIAALIVLGNTFLGAEYGEPFALTVWPLLLLLPTLLVLGFLTREIGGAHAVLPCMIFALASPRVAVFSPGQIDHHNVQILLCLMISACVLISQRVPRFAFAAGAAVPLSLSVGLESIAYALICCAWFPVLWILKGQDRAAQMAQFALGLFIATGILTASLHVPVSGLAAQCDVLSFAYVPALMLGGLGLYALAKTKTAPERRLVRASAVSVLAAGCVLSIATLAPDCLKGPYATLTPELRPIWFDLLQETWGLPRMLKEDPENALRLYPYVASALACGAWALWTLAKNDARKFEGLGFVYTMLAAGTLLGTTQVRALSGALFFAVPVLAVFTTLVRERIKSHGRTATALATWVLAWALGTNALWLTPLRPASATLASDHSIVRCRPDEGLVALNKMPPGVVVNSVDLGPWIAAHSRHGAVSGPYHRNERGIFDAHRALTAAPRKARALIAKRRGRYVAWCKSTMLVEANANGLVAQIERGVVPDWLRPLTAHGETGLRLFEVVDPKPR